MSNPLEGRNTIIYGAGGGIGGAVARAFARDGARVFLAGRTRGRLDAVAGEITTAGGAADVAVVDALDERAVDEHVRAVVATAGSVDVSFNLIARGDAQGTPLVEMATDDLLRAVVNGLRSAGSGRPGSPRPSPGRSWRRWRGSTRRSRRLRWR